MAAGHYSIRLRSDQREEIAKARKIKNDATELRSSVASAGEYNARDAIRFWKIIEDTQTGLMASNTELAERAGFGSQFFSSVARDRRRPKLTNFLKALSVIIEVANEHLRDVGDGQNATNNTQSDAYKINTRLRQDHAELLSLAKTLARLARDEIEKIDANIPNDPDTIASNEKQRELLEIFAGGFDKIANALAKLSENPDEPILLGKAGKLVNGVGKQVSKWLSNNAQEAIDWSLRISTFAAGVTVLGWAGAEMTAATYTVGVIIGGEKVAAALKGK